MRFFANKFFILGILALLVLIGIPLTIFFVKQQQELRSSAVASSVLSIEEAPTAIGIGEEFDVEVAVDPGENDISFVKFELKFDPTKFSPVKITPNNAAFPVTLDAEKLASDSASISVAIGASVTSAIQSPTTVATVRLRALNSLGSTPISFNRANTQVLSVARTDEAGENVLLTADSINITVQQAATQTPVPTISGGARTSPTPTTSLTNQAPFCTQLVASPSAAGVAPFNVTFTASGNDANGTLSKATFNFGDGTSQDITTNNQKTASVQASHIYTVDGTYNATTSFTDDNGAVSASCTQAIQVGDVATPTPSEPPSPTPTPTIVEPTPTLAETGDPTVTTFGIVGGVLLVIIGGIVFFVL